MELLLTGLEAVVGPPIVLRPPTEIPEVGRDETLPLSLDVGLSAKRACSLSRAVRATLVGLDGSSGPLGADAGLEAEKDGLNTVP